MKGFKHLIECHCVLPQYRKLEKHIYHKFIVFSIIDDSDTVIPKYSQCNNCGVIHKVFDICKSEIISGTEELTSLTTIEDLQLMLSDDIVNVLKSYDVDVATYEYVKFILDEKKWGEHVVLTQDSIKDEITGKILIVESAMKSKIETFIRKTSIDKRQKYENG